jgi:tetratricopeptide (TPR) repeat protein
MDKLSIKIDPALLGMIDFGVGIYHFIISLVPPSLQIITNIAGFEADRDKAFEEFNRTIKSGCIWSPLATIICTGLKHFFLDDKEGAKGDLEQLQQSFPNSVIVCYFSGFMYRMNGDPLKAVDQYSRILELIPGHEKISFSINYQIAYAHLLVNNWEKVIVHFEKFLQRPVKENYDKALRPYACYILSFAYFMQSNKTLDDALKTKINTTHENAKSWMRPDESWDKYSLRKIKEYEKKQTFDPFDQLFIRCEALREGHQWDQCLKILESEFTDLLAIPENLSKRDYFAVYYYMKGCCQKGMKCYEEAELTLRKALKEEGGLATEVWIIPFSWLVMGEMFIEMKKWEEASKCFDTTKNYKDYDWEKVLAVRIYAWRQTINKNWKGAKQTNK